MGAVVIPTAVIVTRGDVDLAPVLDSLPAEWPVVVWDNSKREEDLKVYGHFAALIEVQTEYVYMQDDDAICPAQAVLDAWRPEYADKILLNVPDGETPWISWGSIFHKDLPWPALSAYQDAYPRDDDFLLWCDVIFSTLTPWVNVDLGADHLDYAYAAYRMWKQPNHYIDQARVKERCLGLLKVAA